MNVDFLILAAALALVYGTISGIASRSIVTPPMAFMLTGVLCGPLAQEPSPETPPGTR